MGALIKKVDGKPAVGQFHALDGTTPLDASSFTPISTAVARCKKYAEAVDRRRRREGSSSAVDAEDEAEAEVSLATLNFAAKDVPTLRRLALARATSTDANEVASCSHFPGAQEVLFSKNELAAAITALRASNDKSLAAIPRASDSTKLSLARELVTLRAVIFNKNTRRKQEIASEVNAGLPKYDTFDFANIKSELKLPYFKLSFDQLAEEQKELYTRKYKGFLIKKE